MNWIRSARDGTVWLVPASDANASVIESDRRCVALLAGIGGFVDAAGFLVIFGLFTAHMSGNSTGLGVALATGQWNEALRRGFVIPVFVLATVAGVAWIEWRSGTTGSRAARNRAIAGVLGAELILLAVFMVTAALSSRPIQLVTDPGAFFLSATAATLAMGLQNAALRRVQTTAVHTTFVTGMLTELAVASVHWRLHIRRNQTGEALRARSAAWIAGTVWFAYLLGALGGAWLVFHHGIWTLLLPILSLAGMLPLLLRPTPNPSP